MPRRHCKEYKCDDSSASTTDLAREKKCRQQSEHSEDERQSTQPYWRLRQQFHQRVLHQEEERPGLDAGVQRRLEEIARLE